MKLVWFALKALFLVVASYYASVGAFELMSYPNDLTFIGGLVILLLLVLFWGDMAYVNINKFFDYLEERQEKKETKEEETN